MGDDFEYNRKVRQEHLKRRCRAARRRRVRTAVIAIAILSVICIFSANAIISEAGVSPGAAYTKQYTKVIVEQGETVWSIAEAYASENIHSHAELIEEIGFINGLNDAYDIWEDEILIVPYYVKVTAQP